MPGSGLVLEAASSGCVLPKRVLFVDFVTCVKHGARVFSGAASLGKILHPTCEEGLVRKKKNFKLHKAAQRVSGTGTMTLNLNVASCCSSQWEEGKAAECGWVSGDTHSGSCIR